jgi:hypothetical protein
MRKPKPAPIVTAFDLQSAIAAEQKFCDQLIDASNIQLQSLMRSPDVEAESEALDRICDAIDQSIRVIGSLNIQLLELALARSPVERALKPIG